MRKIIIALAFLLTAVSGVFIELSAQQIFKVYKQDGSIEVFYYSTLDSITFKRQSEADDEMIQLFHTRDSLYQIPVNEIDSVSFTKLPTIYKPEAFQLDGKFRDYIIGSDSLTLFVKTTIPDKLLPKQGDNIATLECDEILPYGFIGQVETITHDENAIRIECSMASLIDIFESVEIAGIAATEDLNSPSNLPIGMARAPGDAWRPRVFKITIPSLKGSVNFGHEINTPAGFSGSYKMSAGVELATQSCRLSWVYLQNCTPSLSPLPKVYCNRSYIAQNTLTLSGSLGSEIKWGKEIPIEAIRNIHIPGGTALFELFGEGGIFINISGEVALEGSVTKPFTTIFNVTYDEGKPTAIPPTFRMVGHEAITETTLEGEAAISLGLYGKIGIGLGVKELANVEATFRAGATFSSSLSLTPAATPIEVLNTEMYDEMDRDDFFRGDFTLSGEIAAKVLNNKVLSAELEIGDIFKKNPFFKRGIVPHFEEVSLKKTNQSRVLSAKATMSRKLMFAAPVGFAIYDTDENLVDKWWSPTDYKNKEGEIMTHNFEGLPPGSYTLHPITRAFNDNMVANPSSEENVIPVVKTTDATNITSISSTLNGLLDGAKKAADFVCGFYYSTSPSVGPENGTLCMANTYNKGSFSATVKNLKVNTEYFYRACLIIDEDNIVMSDEIRSFKTSDEYDIDFAITYPSYYYYGRIGNNDWIDFAVAINPSIKEADKDKIIAYGPVIYNDGAYASGYMLNVNEQYLIDGWVSTSRSVYRSELEIDNSAYRAVAPKTYKIGVQFKKVTEAGDTITLFSKEKKQLEWIYDERPAIAIYKCRIYNSYVADYEKHEYGLWYDVYYDTNGGFWKDHDAYKGPNYLYIYPYDNYTFGTSTGYNYTINNIPLGLIAGWVDVNGNEIYSNLIPFEHDSEGLILPLDFEDYGYTLHKNGYEFRWPTIYKNSGNRPIKQSVSDSDFIIKETQNGKTYIRKPSPEGAIPMVEK